MCICNRLDDLKNEINNSNVTVIAVTKTKPVEIIKNVYECKHKSFGENKAQELVAKYEQLKELDIEWHMIGHLQRNKVKYIAPFVSMIHSVDSLKLLKEINKQATKNNRVINCLLQFHIATEDSKFGLNIEECEELLNSDEFKTFSNIKICGVMGMATYTDNLDLVRNEFRTLKNYYDYLKENYFTESLEFKEISMGMTNDWEIALEEGATILRIGTLIFGKR